MKAGPGTGGDSPAVLAALTPLRAVWSSLRLWWLRPAPSADCLAPSSHHLATIFLPSYHRLAAVPACALLCAGCTPLWRPPPCRLTPFPLCVCVGFAALRLGLRPGLLLSLPAASRSVLSPVVPPRVGQGCAGWGRAHGWVPPSRRRTRLPSPPFSSLWSSSSSSTPDVDCCRPLGLSTPLGQGLVDELA